MNALKNLKLISLITIALLYVTAINGQQKEKLLIGTWERVKEKSKEPQIQIGSSNSEPIEVLLMFKEDRTIKVKQGPQTYEADYVLNTKELTLGNKKYELLKLDADSLIIREVSSWKSLASTYKYFKTDKQIKEQ